MIISAIITHLHKSSAKPVQNMSIAAPLQQNTVASELFTPKRGGLQFSVESKVA